MKKNIGFVGSSYADFIVSLSNEYDVIAFADKSSNEVFPDIVKQIIRIDFSSKEKMFHDLQEHSELEIVSCVATYENAILPKTWICEWFRLPGLSEESALISTDKRRMRERFAEKCPSMSPAFQSVTNWDEVEEFAMSHHFPLMLKPTNLFKSLLVTKNDSLEELKKNFVKSQLTIQEIYEKENVKRIPELIIEEFMEGPSYSIEIFSDSVGQTCAVTEPADLVMGRDLGIRDNFNYLRTLPSALSEADIIKIKDVAQAGVKALGFTSSPAHVELILTSTGPKIIEIGARVGGYRPRMYNLAFGIDLFQAQVGCSLGKLPQITEKFHKYVAVYELFAAKEGVFFEVKNWEKVSNLPSLYYCALKRKVGMKTGLSSDGYRAVAVIILSANTPEIILKDRQFIEHEVSVVVE